MYQSEKILANVKGLRDHLQPDEQPLLNVPAIWDGPRVNPDGEQSQRSMPCDIVLTNQRLLGYVYTTFPRERLFLEQFTLTSITNVSLRQKTFEPIFRELLVSDGQRKVYIRAPRKQIETLYEGLRNAIEQYAPATSAAFESDEAPVPQRPAPVYGRQEIRTQFETSPLGITLLFVGGLVLEIGGAVIWYATRSAPTGMPLLFAGLVCVMLALFTRRQQRR